MNKTSILLSIKPKYANLIFSGVKLCEFRKVLPKKSFNKVYVYSSSPVKKIIGEFDVDSIVTGSKDAIWDMFSLKGGITKDEFYSYFTGETARVICIKNTNLYETPVDLPKNISRPPQNFLYIDNL